MIKIKQQVLEESIRRCEQRLAEIKRIQDSDPKGTAIRLEIETLEKAKELTKQGKHTECSKLLDRAKKEVDRLWAMPNPLVGDYADALLEERVDLDMQLQDLKNELFYTHKCYTK